MIGSQPTDTRRSSDPALASLRSALHGSLVLPGDPSYDAARRVWNGDIDRYPAAIVRCADAQDVLRAVELARQRGPDVAVRGGGHSAPGFSTTDGGMVIDLSPMKSIQVNPDKRMARVEPGVTLGELAQATQAHGLAINVGTVSDTGIAGLTLGGGLGWLMGKFGLTCDDARAFEIVTADGRLLRVSPEENADLFWALRGGGGNFGIVTAFEFRLHPVGLVLGGTLVHPLSRARDVLRLYRDLTRAAPDELTAGCALLTAPTGQKAIGISLCYCGDLAEGERLIAPLRQFGPPLVDGITPVPYTSLFAQFDPLYRRGRSYHVKGTSLPELSDDTLDRLVEGGAGMASPHSHILITNLHGAASRIGTRDTAFPFREPHYDVLHVAAWENAATQDHLHWLRSSWGSIQSSASQTAYVNFMDDEGTARVRAAYGPNYERLAALKSQYDPTNLFHLNQNIKPVD